MTWPGYADIHNASIFGRLVLLHAFFIDVNNVSDLRGRSCAEQRSRRQCATVSPERAWQLAGGKPAVIADARRWSGWQLAVVHSRNRDVIPFEPLRAMNGQNLNHLVLRLGSRRFEFLSLGRILQIFEQVRNRGRVARRRKVCNHRNKFVHMNERVAPRRVGHEFDVKPEFCNYCANKFWQRQTNASAHGGKQFASFLHAC